ncbi:hypothetical protein TcasGA2_TC008080 [Tribolium castaneum]|uniref:Uncharacterized protein n=1 Tax=Tribolium castaneum TaxID=7070 RepID=D1ZZQ0_TRICA|nr:hypothetical protein TcasGA2_TC008080 [Tribolium castaneum]
MRRACPYAHPLLSIGRAVHLSGYRRRRHRLLSPHNTLTSLLRSTGTQTKHRQSSSNRQLTGDKQEIKRAFTRFDQIPSSVCARLEALHKA